MTVLPDLSRRVNEKVNGSFEFHVIVPEATPLVFKVKLPNDCQVFEVDEINCDTTKAPATGVPSVHNSFAVIFRVVVLPSGESNAYSE